MRNSEIFDNFVKIAEEKGIVSKDAPEKAQKKLEQTQRADSMSISDIEMLYGVKNDKEKAQEYEKNIMEIAHPNSAILSPSYDKLNGLVENNIERQNIILNIIKRDPNGFLDNHKYAEELLMALVRLANYLDNKNEYELMTLADACIDQVAETIKKKVINQE